MIKKKIADFQNGDKVQGFFLIKGSTVKVSNAGKRYLDFVLCDKTGDINAKLWDISDINEDDYVSGVVVGVAGDVLQWQNTLQYKISKIRLKTPEDKINIADLVVSAPIDEMDMLLEVKSYVSSMQNNDIRKIVSFFINEYEERLLFYPAAKRNHHSIRSGLLYHVVRMLRMGEKLDEVYGDLNRDLLYAGIILHDMEKINEMYSSDLGLVSEYTKEGQLLGHISMGIAQIKQVGTDIEADEEVIMLLQHMILTHHYEPEFGSPKKPMIPEAEVLHYLDMVDARMYDMQKALSGVNPGEFSEPIFSMDRRTMYKTLLTYERDATESVSREFKEVKNYGEARYKDWLTGLNNRISAIEYLDERIDEYEEQDRQFCMIMCSIDYFKNINESYGRDFGDAVIKCVGTQVKKALGSWFVARWNSRSFVAIVEDKSIEEARELAELAVKSIECCPINEGGILLSVSATFSVVSSEIGDDRDSIIDRVEANLRRGKELVKGKVY